MKINGPLALKRMAFWTVIGLFGLSVVGCHGNDDAPTNTANSEYISGGKSAADKVGAERASAHRPRLPGKGVGN